MRKERKSKSGAYGRIEYSSVRPAYAVLTNFILEIINTYEMPMWKKSLENYISIRRRYK